MSQVSLDSRAFKEDLAKLEQKLIETYGHAALDAGELLAETWQALVPVDSGRYHDSINAYLETVSPDGATAIITSGLGDDYDVYLEYGTHRNASDARSARRHGHDDQNTPWRMPPHPSLRPAFEAARDQMADLMVRELEGVVK